MRLSHASAICSLRGGWSWQWRYLCVLQTIRGGWTLTRCVTTVSTGFRALCHCLHRSSTSRTCSCVKCEALFDLLLVSAGISALVRSRLENTSISSYVASAHLVITPTFYIFWHFNMYTQLYWEECGIELTTRRRYEQRDSCNCRLTQRNGDKGSCRRLWSFCDTRLTSTDATCVSLTMAFEWNARHFVYEVCHYISSIVLGSSCIQYRQSHAWLLAYHWAASDVLQVLRIMFTFCTDRLQQSRLLGSFGWSCTKEQAHVLRLGLALGSAGRR